MCNIAASEIINALKEEDIDAEDIYEDCSPFWEDLKENKSWTGVLLYHISEKFFSSETIGLARLRIIDKKIINKFPSLEYVLPRLFRDQIANEHKITSLKQSERPLRAIYKHGKMSFSGAKTQLRDYHIGTGLLKPDADDGAAQILTKIVRWIKYTLDDDDEFVKAKPARQLKAIQQLTEINDHSGYLSLKADKVLLEPVSKNEIRICNRCGAVRLSPETDVSRCPTCKSEIDGERIPSKEAFRKYIKGEDEDLDARMEQRIFVWRNRVENLLNAIEKDVSNSGLMVFRSEEHTAQISERLNRDDVFSNTELHELQFQDIPVRKASERYRIDEPPIDILSCTTTMEVGIDIGSLTCVALRTVPPHSSNYQQRVGRAGRGSAEVSIAITYIDNSAFAIDKFNNPMSIVRNPSVPPKLYTNNIRILSRHVNASAFQLFSKRYKYNPIDLTFEDGHHVVDQNVLQLMESMGNLGDFLNADEEDAYGLPKFKKWSEEVVG